MSHGSVIALLTLPPRITASGAPQSAWVATGSNNTAAITISHVHLGVAVQQSQINVTVAPATYSSAMSAALYGATMDTRGARFTSDGSRCVVELDPAVYPADQSYLLSITGPAAQAMGFTAGQTSEPATAQWVASADRHLPAIVELLTRVEALETSAGAGGAALSSVRRRRSTYWYAAGPPGAVGTFTPTLGTAYAARVPGLGAGQIIDAVSVEIATALTAGTTGVMDFYVAAPHPAYEYPGALAARLATYTFTSADTGRPAITAAAPYTCTEDGDHWIIAVLRSGTAPALRSHIQNTTVGYGPESPGTPGVSTAGSPGYRHTAFPDDTAIVPGSTLWTASVDPANIVPRYYFRMG